MIAFIRHDLVSYWGLIPIVVFVTIIAVTCVNVKKRGHFSIWDAACLVAGVLIFLGLIAEPIAKVGVYYNDKDVVEWCETLEQSKDAISRKQAVIALNEILEKHHDKYAIRSIVLDCLIKTRAREALPFLEKLVTEQEDKEFRNALRETIDRLKNSAEKQ